jgi:hypothetical protein
VTGAFLRVFTTYAATENWEPRGPLADVYSSDQGYPPPDLLESWAYEMKIEDPDGRVLRLDRNRRQNRARAITRLSGETDLAHQFGVTRIEAPGISEKDCLDSHLGGIPSR